MDNVFINKEIFKGVYIFMLKNLFNKRIEIVILYEKYVVLVLLFDK